MADESWYRRRTWTAEDQSEFHAKLRRSRGGFQKAQYCRIQAYELQQAGNFKGALELLDLLMAEWSDDAQKAQVFSQKAQCLEALGSITEALVSYRLVFDTQRKEPGTITNAHLAFGMLVALAPCPELYDEALSVLDEFESPSWFPYLDFSAATIRALIADAKGDRELAARQAKAALTEAAKTHSGYSRHPRLGLVTSIKPDLESRLNRIARITQADI